MPRLLPLLLLCLLLLTAACRKDTTEPEPDKPGSLLEGRWNFQSVTRNTYKPDNTLLGSQSFFSDPHYLIFTAGTVTYYNAKDNSLTDQFRYVHDGNHIDYSSPQHADMTVLELTEHRLTMQADTSLAFSKEGYSLLVFKYTR